MRAETASLTVAELLATLDARQVRLETAGERLRFSAPPGALTPELRNELVARKAEIVEHLSRPARRSEGVARATEATETNIPYEKLFEPVRIGPLALRNRIVLSPMEVDLGAREGTVTDRAVAYYAERARGGVGMIVVEATCVDAPEGLVSQYQLRADRDAFIPGLARLARAIRGAGARAVLQLQHAGRKASALLTGCQPVAPSVVASHTGETPRALSRDEIAALVDRYAEAAARARLAGFDGVEIHAAHGYLVSQFLSPVYNTREDEYGGSAENRGRLLLALIAAIGRRVGRDYPVLCRLSAADLSVAGEIRPLPGGLALAETVELARRLEAAGVAALDVSATIVGLPRMHPMSWPEGHLVPAAEAIKRAVAIPVSVTSRVSPELAERHLREGRIDLVRLGRVLLADPWLPQKLARGRAEEVTPCIFCSQCVDPLLRQPEAICAVNPALGREALAHFAPAPERKRVVVVGGGPGGMEAARVAAMRGHQVWLFEERDELGGQLRVASKPAAARKTLDRLREHLARRLAGLDLVEVRLGERFTPDLLAGLSPDAVVLATGARSAPPEIPRHAAGIDGIAGIAASAGTTAIDVFAGATTGERVAVLGSELVGCEAALYLAAQGKRVALLGRSREPASRVSTDLRTYLLWALAEAGIEIHNRAEVLEIVPGGVLYRDAQGARLTVAAESVVYATGARPADELRSALSGKGPALFSIGDCNRPRGLREALREGFEVGLAL